MNLKTLRCAEHRAGSHRTFLSLLLAEAQARFVLMQLELSSPLAI